LTRLTSLWQASCPSKYFTSASSSGVALAYDDHQSEVTDSRLAPLLVCHGMLGSRLNWNSIAKRIHATTGRRVVTVDARNHGDSPHCTEMSYSSMAGDLAELVAKLGLGPVCLAGHSMGGRTVMSTALAHDVQVERLICLDISPLNKEIHERK